MNTLFRLIIVIGIASVGTGVRGQTTGAFGLRQGMPISSLKVIQKLENGIYRVSVPVPNPEFEAYSVVATPDMGVCKVLGVGKDHDNDRFGGEVRSAYEQIKSALTQRYGISKDFDFLRVGALWDEDNEWVMAVKQNERRLVSFWSAENGSSLPASIEGITLKVSATSSNSAYITVIYEFSNFDNCMTRIKAVDNRGL